MRYSTGILYAVVLYVLLSVRPSVRLFVRPSVFTITQERLDVIRMMKFAHMYFRSWTSKMGNVNDL